MKITSKGQVTIPQALRERYGFLPHTEVEFKPMRDGLKLVRSERRQTRAGVSSSEWLVAGTGT